jgi:hypothetical protein
MRGGAAAANERSRSTGLPADQLAASSSGALRRVGPSGPHARRKAQPCTAPRSGASLIQYGPIRQWSCRSLVLSREMVDVPSPSTRLSGGRDLAFLACGSEVVSETQGCTK